MPYTFWQICCGIPHDREHYEIQGTAAAYAIVIAIGVAVIYAEATRCAPNCCIVFMLAIIAALVACCAVAALGT